MINKVWRKLGALPALVVGLLLAALGAVLLYYLVDYVWPVDVERLDLIRAIAQDRTDAPQLLEAIYLDVLLAFLAGVGLLIMGLSTPLAYLLNSRFHPQGGSLWLSVRQGFWMGGWASFCVWLQMNRALTTAVALLIATVFILFEILLQVRAQAVPTLPPALGTDPISPRPSAKPSEQ